MSTSKSKKPTTKAIEPKAKYAIGNTVFMIERLRTKSGEVLQAEILTQNTVKVPQLTESGKVSHYLTDFGYDIRTAYGIYEDVHETELYPTLQAVAMSFTNQFTHLLK